MRAERIEPGPEQESVWDYPRPPRIESFSGHVKVTFNNVVIADTHAAKRVLETSHPPVFYIPPRDIEMHYLENSPLTTYCEFKGVAHYYSVVVNEKKRKMLHGTILIQRLTFWHSRTMLLFTQALWMSVR